MGAEEREAVLVSAKLTMVRYWNALQAIRDRARSSGYTEIDRLASVALRETKEY